MKSVSQTRTGIKSGLSFDSKFKSEAETVGCGTNSYLYKKSKFDREEKRAKKKNWKIKVCDLKDLIFI